MIQRVYEQCGKSNFGETVIVATDDQRIADVVRGFGGMAMMTPSTCTSGTERMACVADVRGEQIFVNVQGDEPLIDPRTIDATIRILLDTDLFDISTACCPLLSYDDYVNPNVVKVVRSYDSRALYFSRAPIPHQRDAEQGSVPVAARKHIGIYAFRREALLRFSRCPSSALEQVEQLEQLRALEIGLAIGFADIASESIAVDTVHDLDRVNMALREPTHTRSENHT